jgi:hypothetical protein
MRHVAAFGTEDAGYSKYFDRSCREVGGFEPQILGRGREWKGFRSGFEFGIEWLTGLPPDDLVLMLDRYDIVVTDSLHRAFDAFEASGSDILVSTESANLSTLLMYGKLKEFGRAINTGAYVMRAGAMLEMYKAILEKYPASSTLDDQKMITDYLNETRGRVKVALDSETEPLFLVYVLADVMTGSRLRFHDAEPGTSVKSVFYQKWRPVLIHRPYNGDMSAILRKIGYSVDEDEGSMSYYKRAVTYFRKLLF